MTPAPGRVALVPARRLRRGRRSDPAALRGRRECGSAPHLPRHWENRGSERATPEPRDFRSRPSSNRAGIARDRKSVVSGKSVSVRVDLGGRRIIKQIILFFFSFFFFFFFYFFLFFFFYFFFFFFFFFFF